MIPAGSLCFVDVETLGLDARRHAVWEFAGTRVVPLPDGTGWEVENLDLTIQVSRTELRRADPTALRICGFYERYDTKTTRTKYEASKTIATFTAGCHLVAASPSFDDRRLERLLHKNGYSSAWHYHLVDVEAAASGYLRGMYAACKEMDALGTAWGAAAADAASKAGPPPWESKDLSHALGVDPNAFDRHTSRGDVDWTIAWYELIYGVKFR